MYKREDILELANQCVNGSRDEQYGTPENNFKKIAELWSIYLGFEISDVDVAAMMALMKISRISNGNRSVDSWIDLAGYAACGGEISKFEDNRATCIGDE